MLLLFRLLCACIGDEVFFYLIVFASPSSFLVEEGASY